MAPRRARGRLLSALENGGKGCQLRTSCCRTWVPADELEIRVSPDAIIVAGKAGSQQDRRERNICFSEFGQRVLLRRFLPPKQIDPNQVSASLQEGVVTIVPSKAMTLLPKTVAAEPSVQQKAVQQKGKTSAA
jgi:hypothetical protein